MGPQGHLPLKFYPSTFSAPHHLGWWSSMALEHRCWAETVEFLTTEQWQPRVPGLGTSAGELGRGPCLSGCRKSVCWAALAQEVKAAPPAIVCLFCSGGSDHIPAVQGQQLAPWSPGCFPV